MYKLANGIVRLSSQSQNSNRKTSIIKREKHNRRTHVIEYESAAD